METVAAMPFDDLVQWLDVQGKRRFADPEDNARRLQRIAQDSYQLPEAWLTAVNTALTLSLRHLSVLEQLLTRLDSAIADLMAQIPNSLTTIPGIGSVFAAGIIAEIGDLARFDYRHEKVASFAGLKWSKHQSADFTAEKTPLKRTGSVTCVTISAKRLSGSECTMLSTALSTRKSMTKSVIINISEPLS